MTYIWLSLLSLSLWELAEASPRTIYATSRGGSAFYNGKTIRTEELQTAVRKARPGDTVQILPGTYSRAMEISKSSDLNNPITIKGTRGLSVFSCADTPATDGKPAIRVSVSAGLIFEDLTFKNCWPNAISFIDTSFIRVRKCEFFGGQAAIKIEEQSSHHFYIDENQWTQSLSQSDPLGEINSIKPFEGGFVHMETASGTIFITKNQIHNGYSLLKITTKKPEVVVQNVFVSENETKLLAKDLLITDIVVRNLQYDLKSSLYLIPLRLYTPPLILKEKRTAKESEFEFSEPIVFDEGDVLPLHARWKDGEYTPKSCRIKASHLKCIFSQPIEEAAKLFLHPDVNGRFSKKPVTLWPYVKSVEVGASQIRTKTL